MSFELVSGDLAPMPVTVFANGVGVAVDVADIVELRWQRPDGTTVLVPLVAVDRSLGKFQRIWAPGDTTQVGTHYGQVVVTTGSTPVTYPGDGNRLIWYINPQV